MCDCHRTKYASEAIMPRLPIRTKVLGGFKASSTTVLRLEGPGTRRRIDRTYMGIHRGTHTRYRVTSGDHPKSMFWALYGA